MGKCIQYVQVTDFLIGASVWRYCSAALLIDQMIRVHLSYCEHN
jgi:hypothetical protein